ncbi:Hpt domain-containing protein [Polaribacter dokdonensis]|uniref:HPt (Histidine-containing phosphotransfer) domain-containing protein n=1 Tax=Polaribacter dokdonensis DSW-5 TaxID=1300348 RepID=A0A0N0CGD0_9FLAO|nr:Hpt domain-containing protein [Polaribacter dokdonensis]KOY53164.1 Histidine kinase [Polaribacter dokdonensis DSW-5]SEE57990.1 HPt (histidine-containing phosphotransfer) domain-containing protein [Polaribacter dokdonensis DSW-5]
MQIENILTSDVVDLTSLKSFFSTDKDSLIQLVTVYLSDTQPRLELLKKSIITVNHEEVRSICHFLKSSLGLMGVNCLEEITLLEKKAQNLDPEPIIQERLKHITVVLDQSIIEYQRILDQLKAL